MCRQTGLDGSDILCQFQFGPPEFVGRPVRLEESSLHGNDSRVEVNPPPSLRPRTSTRMRWITSGSIPCHGSKWPSAHGLAVFDRGEGSTIYDVHGNAFLDGIAGLWVVNAGHGRKEIAEAMGQQAARLAYASSMNFTTVPAVQLAEMIAERTPGDLNRVFFSSGGSEAVESAIKIAKQIQAMRGFARRYKIIARRGSYHGMTYGAMSLTALKNEHYFGPFMYGVSHVPIPIGTAPISGSRASRRTSWRPRPSEQEIMFQGPDTVAAVIGEPISTAAGVHVPSKIYWQMLREICDKHGVLLIADEVSTDSGVPARCSQSSNRGLFPTS